MYEEAHIEVTCPECGMDYHLGEELQPDTVYVCGHCETELVPGGIDGLIQYWGEFSDEDSGDTAPRVELVRKRYRDGILDGIKAMFTEGMKAAAGQ